MKRHALTGSKLCATLLLIILPFHTPLALAQKPEVNVTIFRDLVRFAAPGDAQETRIEIFNSTGEKIFDSNFVAGQTQDWPLQDLKGEKVGSGLYTYTVTVKNQGGIVKQAQRGNVIVDQEREGLEAAPPIDHSQATPTVSTQPQSTGIWNVDQDKTSYVINAPAMGIGTRNPLARLQIGTGTVVPITKGSTLLLEEGEATGMVIKSTSGGEIFFSQDKQHGLFGTASNHPLAIRTNNENRLWITGEGNIGIGTISPNSPLTVAGMIEVTSGGIKFPDGTIQTTAAGGSATNSDDVIGSTGTVNNPRPKKGAQPAGLATDPWLMGGNSGVTTSNFLGTTDSQPLVFKTNSVEAMRINPSGFLGITMSNATGSANYMNVKDGVHEILLGVDGGGGILSTMTNHDLILRAGGNSEKLRITANGNVGIGQANPGQKLDVYGAAASIRVSSSSDAEHGVIVSPEGANERAYLYTTGGNANHAGHLRLSNGNSDITIADILMRNAAGSSVNYITNSGNSYFTGGNVGIGLTNPGSRLTVGGVIETTSGGIKFPDGTTQTTRGLSSVVTTCCTLEGNGTTGSPLKVASPLTLVSNVSNETFSGVNTNINATGVGVYGQAEAGKGVKGVANSGIGVYGSSTSGEAGHFDGKVIVNVPASSSPISAVSIDVQSFNNSANAMASHYFRVRDIGGGFTPFYIRGNGNVGIGTTSPSSLLHLEKAGEASGSLAEEVFDAPDIILQNTGSQGKRWRIASGALGNLLLLNGTPGVDQKNVFYASRNGITVNGFIQASGIVRPQVDTGSSLGDSSHRWTEVWAMDGTIHTSDARLKKDITDLEYGLSKVMQLRPVTFKWKDRKEDSRVRIGLIAQETEKIIPEVVERGEDANSTMGLNYESLVPVLIKAIQEQQTGLANKDARIGALEAENSNQQKRITELEDKLVMLDERILAFEQMLQSRTASARTIKSKSYKFID